MPLLTEHFLRTFSEKTGRRLRGFGANVMSELMEYDWPGNVRELANVIERAAIMATDNQITFVDLPSRRMTRPADLHDAGMSIPFKEGREKVIEEYEKTYLMDCLRRFKGNIGQCAQHCGIDAKTFYRKMQEYELDRRAFKKSEVSLDHE